MYRDIPHGTQIDKDDIAHSTEHNHGAQVFPLGTQDIPHCTRNIRHSTEPPPRGTEHTLYRVISTEIVSKKYQHLTLKNLRCFLSNPPPLPPR